MYIVYFLFCKGNIRQKVYKYEHIIYACGHADNDNTSSNYYCVLRDVISCVNASRVYIS